ncbi:uncharacterized protein LOC116146688 isoform X2 [Pistacia vera]|uniref:uncharacterized protein LOC116146688 isoform X2 n=1 Tax=Pistacia vera TaxID=55513 RepID=UPI001262D650|nr:uncharacterized protein LOC116146688 isoform X2 [Pistacia vera]
MTETCQPKRNLSTQKKPVIDFLRPIPDELFMFSPSETSLTMSEDQEMLSIEIDELLLLRIKRRFSELNQEMLSVDPPEEQSFQAVENENGHTFNLTETGHFSWEALSSPAREGKANAGSPDESFTLFLSKTSVTVSEDQDEMGHIQSCQPVVNENGHKFNMTEGEYNLWKDVLIQIISEEAEVVRRQRSEAREGKAKAASPASQELKTEGRSSTGNYARESTDLESGSSSTQAGDVPAERTNLETQGGSSTAQNEPLPNHQGLPGGCDHTFGGGDHQVHKPQVNMRSKLPEEKAKAGSPDLPPGQDLQDTVSKVNLWTSLAFISAPIFLDREYYKDRNSDSYKLFDAFMICIILSFTGAFCALLIRNKPKLAVLRGCYFLLSIVSMASALSILGYALFWKV